MKKLMCALAAVSAGLCMADVTSANIVGYQNKELRSGYKLVGSIFNKIGDKEGKVMLSDIKPTGYENNQDFIDETYTAGDFQIILLSSNGGTAGYYEWTHTYDPDLGKWNDDGAWDDDIELAPGQGLWFNANVFEEGYSLSVAGEPLMAPRNVPLRLGYSPITIPLARSVRLSEIKPVGYENNPDFIEETYTAGDFQVIILAKNGGTDGYFEWTHTYDPDEQKWNDDGAWDDDYEFQPGDAIWVNANVYDVGYELSFPGIDDQAE